MRLLQVELKLLAYLAFFLTSSAAAGIAEIEIGHANVTVTAGA